MTGLRYRRGWRVLLVVIVSGLVAPRAQAQETDAELRDAVLDAIEQGKRYLIRNQEPNGSWTSSGTEKYPVGTTSLALLALLNCGMTAEDPPVRKTLELLRRHLRLT